MAAAKVDISPWRKRITLTAVYVGLFLSFIDTTIISVALPTIAAEFDAFAHSTWVITAYLLTYMAFGIIVSRLSDIFGRRTMEITCFIIFLAFSLGCGLSKSETQLIIFRACQGIGGSGLFSMTMILAFTLVSPKSRGMVSSAVGICMASAGILGPVLGGAISGGTTSHTWRWIFYLNLPIGGLALLAFIICCPRDISTRHITLKTIATVDFLGSVLILAASVLLVFALQQAGAYIDPWNSGTIIACLTVSAFAFIAFAAWQALLAQRPKWIVKQTFPIVILKDRVVASITLVTLLSGATYYIAVVYLPQRFQIVDGNSPVLAGVKMLPMLLGSALGSTIAGNINAKRNFTTYTLMIACSFQLLGYGLMSMFGNSTASPKSIYGFEIFLGLGFGCVISTVTIGISVLVDAKWTASSQGALTQFRSLGGSLGLAAGVIITNQKVQLSQPLQSALTPAQIDALYKSPLIISTFTPAEQRLVAEVYSSAFSDEMRVALYLAVATFLFSCLTWQKNPPPAPAQLKDRIAVQPLAAATVTTETASPGEPADGQIISEIRAADEKKAHDDVRTATRRSSEEKSCATEQHSV